MEKKEFTGTVVFICKKCMGIFACKINGVYKECIECPTYHRRNKSTCLSIQWVDEKRQAYCIDCKKEKKDE